MIDTFARVLPTPLDWPMSAALFLPVLAGCSSAPVAEDTPLLRSSVISGEIRNNGFKAQFASDSTRLVSTLAEIQRVDNRSKFTSSVLRRLAPKSNRREIVRRDKNLEREMDNRKMRYRECQIAKCYRTTSLTTAPEPAASERH